MLKLRDKNLDVWLKSIKLVSEVYRLSKSWLKEEQLGLTSQIRRSAISIPSNIAEGVARSSNLETVRFLDITSSSLVEFDKQIQIAINLKYLNNPEIDKLSETENHTFSMLSKLIQKLKMMIRLKIHFPSYIFHLTEPLCEIK
jgi:four helix bundle protein